MVALAQRHLRVYVASYFFVPLALLLFANGAGASSQSDGLASPGSFDSGFGTIQAAIDAAEFGDTLDLPPGTFDEELFITAKQLVLRPRDGVGTTILSGGSSHRILLCRDSIVRLEDLVFQDGLAGYGAAVFALGGVLSISDCEFRDNTGGLGGRESLRDGESFRGGAIFSSGEGAVLQVEDCSFAGNETVGSSARGGAVACTIRPGRDVAFTDANGEYKRSLIWGALQAEIDPALDAEWSRLAHLGSSSIYTSTFVDNKSGSGTSVFFSEDRQFDIAQCLFLDERSPGDVVSRPRSSGLDLTSCSIFWNPALNVNVQPPDPLSRQQEGGTESRVEDPILCWEDDSGFPTLHGSSPALTDSECGPIGSLEVGCSGPMVAWVGPSVVRRGPNVLRLYGAALGEVTEAVLRLDPDHEVVAESWEFDSTWGFARFDLADQPSGEWTLVLRGSGGDLVTVEHAVTLKSGRIHTLQEPWISNAGVIEQILAGEDLHSGLGLTLVHRQTQDLVAVSIEEHADPGSLAVSFELFSDRTGVYDLVLSVPLATPDTLHNALYLGEPPEVHVPGDYPTLQAAIDASLEPTRILVDEGEYDESIVIDRPVWLQAAGEGRTSLRAETGERRAIEILFEAGPLVRLEGLFIGPTTGPGGDGGGVLARGAVDIQDCWFYLCKTGTSGNGGGAWLGPGSRVRESVFSSNLASGDIPNDDWAVFTEGRQGLGGGLFGRSVFVDGCQFASNTAESGGGAVLTGILRNSEFQENSGADVWTAPCTGASQFWAEGEVTGNTFESVYDQTVVGVLESGSHARLNTFVGRSILREHRPLVKLRGAVSFENNSMLDVGLFLCPFEYAPGPFTSSLVVRDNVILEYPGWSWTGGCCAPSADGLPQYELPPENIEIGCNLAEGVILHATSDILAGCDSCFVDVDPLFCNDELSKDTGSQFDLRLRIESPAIPGGLPFACEDTLGALPVGCQVIPVLIQGANVSRVPERGVVLEWSTLNDLDVAGFVIDRESSQGTVQITDEMLPNCDPCTYVDTSAPTDLALDYWLVLLFSDGTDSREFFGSVPAGSATALSFRQELVVPNPAREDVMIRFQIPEQGPVRATLIDARGRRVAAVFDEVMSPGSHRRSWFVPESLPDGVYWLRLEFKGRVDTRSLLVLR